MDKWRSIAAGEADAEVDIFKQRLMAASEWRLQYIKSGAARFNANFVPVQQPDL
jgi:hypothetical protein